MDARAARNVASRRPSVAASLTGRPLEPLSTTAGWPGDRRLRPRVGPAVARRGSGRRLPAPGGGGPGLVPDSGTGGTPSFAIARRDQLGGPGHELGVAGEQALGEADPTRDGLVEVDRGGDLVRGADLGHEPEIARIDHQQNARHRLQGATGPGQRDVEVGATPGGEPVAHRQPIGGRLELDLGQVDAAPAEVLVGPELQLLVDGCQARDHHFAVPSLAAGHAFGREDVERLERHREIGLGVVVGVDTPDVGLALVPVEPVDMELGRLVEVDRILVDECLGRKQVHFADDPWPIRRRIDDDHVLLGRRAERDGRGREVLARPVPAAVARLANVAFLGEEGQQLVCRRGPESFTGLEGELERGRLEVGEEHVKVVRVETRFFRRSLEDEVRMMDDVLVDGSPAGDKDRHARAEPTAGPADLLPGCGNGARITGQHRHVEAADVDAQLEGIGADDPQELALTQALLDRPTLGREVAAPVAAHPCSRAPALTERLAERGQDELDRGAAPAEDDRLAPGPQERQSPAVRQTEGRAADARGGVEQGRVDEEQVTLAGRGAVAVYETHPAPRERFRELHGIGDGG